MNKQSSQENLSDSMKEETHLGYMKNIVSFREVFTEAPVDSGIVGFVGVVDMKTGPVIPVLIGLVHPTGMIFVPNMLMSYRGNQVECDVLRQVVSF